MTNRYTPEANAAIEQLQAAGFDYAEADMIYHGDMLGPALGAKTAALITSLREDKRMVDDLLAASVDDYNAVLRERDEAVQWIGVVREELAAAGFPPGDRDVALVSIRSILNPSRKETGG